MGGVTSGGSRDSGRNGLVPLSVAAGPEVVVTLAVQPLTAVRKGGLHLVLRGQWRQQRKATRRHFGFGFGKLGRLVLVGIRNCLIW